ncbi:phage tail terminator family protein [Bacillus sp. AK031]
MITYKDIVTAVNSKLSSFEVEINSRDVKEGFPRPSFFVQLLPSTRSGDVDNVHKMLTVQIYFFPSDRYTYSLEVLEVQENLEYAFDLKLKVQNRYLNIMDAESVLTDGVLNFSFALEFYDGREYEDLENDIIERVTEQDQQELPPIEKMEDLEFKK